MAGDLPEWGPMRNFALGLMALSLALAGCTTPPDEASDPPARTTLPGSGGEITDQVTVDPAPDGAGTNVPTPGAVNGTGTNTTMPPTMPGNTSGNATNRSAGTLP